MRRAPVTIVALLGIAILGSAGGCVPGLPFGAAKQGSPEPEKVAPEAIRELHVVWNDALLELGGKPYRRGFAARAYLFAEGTESPVLADGTFLFFAWREREGLQTASVRPDRTWSFSPGEAAALAKPDSVGWGYTFWLPWGPAEGDELKCTLRGAFRTPDGRVVLSDSATVVLPGKARPLREYKKLEELKQLGTGGDRSTESETISLELPKSLRQ